MKWNNTSLQKENIRFKQELDRLQVDNKQVVEQSKKFEEKATQIDMVIIYAIRSM